MKHNFHSKLNKNVENPLYSLSPSDLEPGSKQFALQWMLFI
jgi:hypothetical protein